MAEINKGARRLRAFLEAQDLNQRWLARKLKVNDSYVSLLLSGDRTPSLTMASQIEDLTGIPAREWAAAA